MSAFAERPPARKPAPRPSPRPAARPAPRPLVPRPAPRSAPRSGSEPGLAPASALVPAGYVAAFDVKDLHGFESPMGTDFFDTLGRISAYGVTDAPAQAGRPAELRGYPAEALKVVASIATHYLYSGGYRLAEVLFEGLTAVAPDQPYHWLGLGLTYDRQNRTKEAEHAYHTAARLDPKDARALVNLAELRVEAGAQKEAVPLLERAVKLAERSEDEALLAKARMMLARFGGPTEARGARS